MYFKRMDLYGTSGSFVVDRRRVMCKRGFCLVPGDSIGGFIVD